MESSSLSLSLFSSPLQREKAANEVSSVSLFPIVPLSVVVVADDNCGCGHFPKKSTFFSYFGQKIAFVKPPSCPVLLKCSLPGIRKIFFFSATKLFSVKEAHYNFGQNRDTH
jgi:hypothetical protein